jgi:capsular polysaccharide transport system permease protein
LGLWLEGLRLQVRVIVALILRETRVHFGEMRLGYLWAVIEPTLHLIAYALIFSYLLRRLSPFGGSLVVFSFTGLIPFFLYYKQSIYLAGAIDGNRMLLNLPPVKPIDVFMARGILEAATYLFAGFIILLCIGIYGVADAVPARPVELMPAFMGTVLLGFGVGITNAVIRIFIRNWMVIFGFLLSPIFLVSGIWFLPSQVPPPYRDYLLYNPLMHYIMWTRVGFYRNYDPAELDRGYALWWSLAVVVLGLTLLRVARRKLLEPV